MIDRLSAALAGHYTIERELGAGGMATVYLAHDIKHDRKVAIQVLHPDLGAALGGERFLSGIRTTARLTMQVDLSPDGHWLAYTGDATGRPEIYVTPFPVATSTRLVSRDGGNEPRWAHSGRELFYKSGNRLMSVDVTPGPSLTIGTPRPLFSLSGYRFARNRAQYDVAPDDQHFVMIKDIGGNTRGDAVYVENWFQELLAKAEAVSIDQLAAALADRYTIERELGGGGMSRVFVATETALNRSIVIKVIAPALLDGMSIDRFAREVRLAARLQHANIVPVLAAGDADGTPYYTMPFVRGDSLRSRMATGAPVPLSDAVHVLRDVARALAYAHGEGVVHRDIKPENILLSGGAAVVTDFGIAKAIDISRTQDGDHNSAVSVTLTQAGSSLGTPAYMAPEQADRRSRHRSSRRHLRLGHGRVGSSRRTSSVRRQDIAASDNRRTDYRYSGTARVGASGSPRSPEPVGAELSPEGSGSPPVSRIASCSRPLTWHSPPAHAQLPPCVLGHALAVPAAAGLGIALIAVAAWAVKGRNGHGGSAVIDKSLAVIPFTSMSSDTGDAYLGEGIADEVTNTLSVVPGLRLAGRSSAARAAQKGATPQEIGTSLRVNSILDGTVRRFGDQIRITAELSNASDGRVIWHENYERAAKDIFGVQDEIARAIARTTSGDTLRCGPPVSRGKRHQRRNGVRPLSEGHLPLPAPRCRDHRCNRHARTVGRPRLDVCEGLGGIGNVARGVAVVCQLPRCRRPPQRARRRGTGSAPRLDAFRCAPGTRVCGH